MESTEPYLSNAPRSLGSLGMIKTSDSIVGQLLKTMSCFKSRIFESRLLPSLQGCSGISLVIYSAPPAQGPLLLQSSQLLQAPPPIASTHTLPPTLLSHFLDLTAFVSPLDSGNSPLLGIPIAAPVLFQSQSGYSIQTVILFILLCMDK